MGPSFEGALVFRLIYGSMYKTTLYFDVDVSFAYKKNLFSIVFHLFFCGY